MGGQHTPAPWEKLSLVYPGLPLPLPIKMREKKINGGIKGGSWLLLLMPPLIFFSHIYWGGREDWKAWGQGIQGCDSLYFNFELYNEFLLVTFQRALTVCCMLT